MNKNEIVTKFSDRMTVLKNNPKRFEDVRFTRYFGGICICYYDTKLYKYVVERICNADDLESKEEPSRDGKSDSVLAVARNKEK